MKHDLTTLVQNLKGGISEPGNLQDILQRIARTAYKYFSPDLCVIFAMNPITGSFLKEEPTHMGKLISPTLKFEYPRNSGLTKKILKNKILALENIPSRYLSPKVEAEKVQSVIGIGLYTDKHSKPLAVMYLDYRKARRFNREFYDDLRVFAEMASSELQTTWFIRRYRAIVKIGQDVNENLEIRENNKNADWVFEIVLEHIRGILDVSYFFSLANYDFRKNRVDLYYVDEGKKNLREGYQLKKSSISRWVLNHLKTVFIGDLRRGKLPTGIKVFHLAKTATRDRSGIFVPIKIGDKPLGVLSVQHWKANYYDEEDVQILELLANHTALALNNFKLLNDLRELDTSGQVLTAGLDPSQDIISDVADRIFDTTQADLITLYPYLKSEEKYISPIHRGKFYNSQSTLREGEATPAAIVHQVSRQTNPIFAVSSRDLYDLVGRKYQEGGRFPDMEKIKSTAALPLKAGSEPIGVLFVNYRTKQSFDPAQRWVINSLATYAAIAIRNSRQFKDLRDRRLQELEDLRQIDQAISKSLKSDDILQSILESTAKHIRADTGVVLLHNKKTKALEPKAVIGKLLPLENLDFSLDRFTGISKVAFDEKRTIRISNVKEDPAWKDRFIRISETTISEMDIPLILDDVAIGVMNFESGRENAFSDEDERFMEILAGQAVIVVRNAFEYERAQRIAVQRKALINTVNVLLSQDDQRELFSTILNEALEITETNKGTLSLYDDNKHEIRIVAKRGLKEEWPDVQLSDKGIVGIAVREKRIIKIDDLSKHPLREKFLDAFPGDEVSELVVPIFDGDKVIGVINLESENPYHYEEDDVELVSSLASLCAVAIKNTEYIEQKRLVSVGFITGDLSHKMKSPLSKIQRQIELVEINHKEFLEKNSEIANRIHQIYQISSDATKMVQKTLDEAKATMVTLHEESLIKTITAALNEVEIPQNISLFNSVQSANIDYTVLATKHLKNVFHTLVSNSIDAMPEGGKIYIELEAVNKEWVIISIEDTGKGVSKEDADLVLLPISATGLTGRGFGLALTNQYVEMIGGKIDPPVKGRNGVGAKFLVHLKLGLQSS